MRVPVLCFLLTAAAVSAFHVAPTRRSRGPAALRMSSSDSTTDQTAVPIVVKGQNVDLTPALTEYVNKRIGGHLNKLSSGGAVRECDVILSVSKNPKVSRDGPW